MSIDSTRGGLHEGPASTRVNSASQSRAVTLFCSVAYLFFLGTLSHLFGSDDEAGGGPLKALFLPVALAIQLTALVLLISPKRLPRTLSVLSHNRTLLLALGVIIVSTFWSIDADITLRRGLALVGTTSIGVLIYIEIGRQNLLKFFATNLAIFTIGSVAFALAVPELGTHGYGKFEGDWRGFLTFKNQAAWAAVIFILTWIGSRGHGWARTWKYPMICVGLLMLFQTKSATGIGALAFGLAAFWTLTAYRRVPMIRPLLVLAVAMMIGVVSLNFQSLLTWGLGALGRDDTLTGRTSIWSGVWPVIEDRFWLGTGYHAFWSHASDFLGSSSWMVGLTHSHNAYIEILLDVGIIGLVTQLVFLLITCRRLFSLSTHGDSDATIMLIIFLTLSVIGIAGALFFRANTGLWIMMVSFSCYAADAQPLNESRRILRQSI